jgi:hypothetical protein
VAWLRKYGYLIFALILILLAVFLVRMARLP